MKTILFVGVLAVCTVLNVAVSPCPGNSVPNGIACNPSLPNNDRCGGTATCERFSIDLGICCEQRCPQGYESTGFICDPSLSGDQCGQGVNCHAKVNGGGICCQEVQQVTCSRPGYEYNGILCNSNLANDRCGLNTVCETTPYGQGICCQQTTQIEYICPDNALTTGARCTPFLNTNQCGPSAVCEPTPDGKGICCKPELTPASCGQNGRPTGHLCSTFNRKVNECGLDASCVVPVNIGNIEGICCKPEHCSGNNVETGTRCIPGVSDNVCGHKAECEPTTGGNGICCRIRPISSFECGGFGLHTGEYCTPGVESNCDKGSVCLLSPQGYGMCCRPPSEYSVIVNRMAR